MTAGAQAALAPPHRDPQFADLIAQVRAANLVQRHVHGDWGDLCEADRQANEEAVNQDLRLLSRYTAYGATFYVITEHDRSYTTVLLCEEY